VTEMHSAALRTQTLLLSTPDRIIPSARKERLASEAGSAQGEGRFAVSIICLSAA
jgi:hypothetical protein